MRNGLFETDTDVDVLLKEDIEVSAPSRLIVYNDDVNTFDWVIECLMDVCEHSFEQAEQSSLLIHYKGKATVKTETFKALRPLKDALCERGLSAVIE